MGLARRNKSGNILGGSKLIVPGLGIYTVKNTPNDKVTIKSQNLRSHSRPTPTPSSTPPPTPSPTLPPTPTPTPTPSVTQTSTPTPTPTPTPSVTQTSTPTPTPTPTPTSSVVCYLSTEFLDNLMTENNDFLIVNCP